MYSEELEIKDRLEEILESIELIQEWSKGMGGRWCFMILTTHLETISIIPVTLPDTY